MDSTYANKSANYIGANCSPKQRNAAWQPSFRRREQRAGMWPNSSCDGVLHFPTTVAPVH